MPASPAETAALRKSCDIRIGFPREDAGSPGDWLRAIADYLDAEDAGDEIYMAGKLASQLEDYCADLMGKPAALWFPTGTMAQMAAALIHSRSTGRKSIGLHPTSHLVLHEDDGISELAGLPPVSVGEWSRVIEARDVEKAGELACLFIELPQRHNGGLCPAWETLTATIKTARESGARLHMDGARLWSLRETLGDRSYAEICAPFDSVYASFYKEVGALGGAILAGEEDFIVEAKIWRHRQGGLQVRAWPMMADALRRLPGVIEAMPDWITAAGDIATLIHDCGFGIEPFPVQTNMFHVRVNAKKAEFQALRDRIAQDTKVWLGGSGWEIDGRDGMSLEIAVDDKLAQADRQRLRGAFERLAEGLG